MGASFPAQAGMEDDDWYEIRSDNFRVITNVEVEEVASLVRELEFFRTAVAAISGTGSDEDPFPFTIIAANNRSDFRQFFSDSFVVGVFSPSLRGYYAIIDLSTRFPDHKGKRVVAAGQILKHEYVHYILRRNSSVRYRYWYEEGFAEYLSTLEYEDSNDRIGFPVAARVRSASRTVSSKLPSVAGLLESSRNDKKLGTDVIYGFGWLLVHHLYLDPDQAPKIQEYL